MKNDVKSVDFYGQEIEVFEYSGEHWVSVRSVCKGMGVHRETQQKKIQNDPNLRWTVIRLPSGGGLQNCMCIHLESLSGWLIQINPNKVKSEIRENVRTFREECFSAIHSYLFEGGAVNPRIGSPEWQAARSDGKVIRNDETHVIKQFIEYAETQGSKNADHYYQLITRATYHGLELISNWRDDCKNLRDELEIKDLVNVTAADQRVLQVIGQSMGERIYYKDIFQLAKESVIRLNKALKEDLIEERRSQLRIM